MDQPATILVLVSSLGGGGAERVATHLCNAWSTAGHHVSLLPTFPTEASPRYSISPTVRLLTPNRTRRSQRKTPWHQLQRLLELRTNIRSLRPDYVITFLTNVNVAGIIGSLGLGVRVVVSERIFPPLFPVGAVLNTLRKLTYPLAWKVVVQTTATQRWFARALPRTDTVVIPNPLVLPLEVTEPILPVAGIVPRDSKLMLAVGRLNHQKGFLGLIEAFARLDEAAGEWHLVILGEGEQRQALAKRAAALGVDSRVHLPGWAGNISQWYARADLFVLSSHFEGFPNALLEAMGHGVACVAYDCPTGPADLIENARSGRLVALDSGAAGLAGAIQSLMNDDRTRQAMATNAAITARRFTSQQVLKQWSDLLELR